MSVPITKTDAARRQLLAAIHLHWYLNEPLAVYTLASNAWELCDTLLMSQERQRLVQALAATHGLPEKKLGDMINSPRNFVKHADRDPDMSLELADDDVDTIVMIACVDYMVLSQRQPLIVDFYLSWFSAVYPARTGAFYRMQADRMFPSLAGFDLLTCH